MELIRVEDWENPPPIPASHSSLVLSIVPYKWHCDVVEIQTSIWTDTLPGGSRARYLKSFYDRWACCSSASTAENTDKWVGCRYDFPKGSWINHGYATKETAFPPFANRDSHRDQTPIKTSRSRRGDQKCKDAALQFLEKRHRHALQSTGRDGSGQDEDQDEAVQAAPRVWAPARQLKGEVQQELSRLFASVQRGIDLLAIATETEFRTLLEQTLSEGRNEPGDYEERLNRLCDIIARLSKEEKTKSLSFQWFAKHESLCTQAVKRAHRIDLGHEDVYRNNWEQMKIRSAVCLTVL